MLKKRSAWGTLITTGVILPLLMLTGMMVLGFAWLRETHLFWTNAGGYPLWLRETVLETFYPLLTVHALLLVMQSLLLVKRPPASTRCCLLEAGTLLVVWFVLAGSVVIVAANNVDNMIHGRPLHAHGEAPE